MIALVDESILLGRCYALSCVVVPLARRTATRRATRRVAPGRTFHWTKERPEVRRAMLGVACQEATHLLGYVRRQVPRRQHESARAALLTALLTDLAEIGVAELLVESRQEHNDSRDRNIIAALQRRDRALAQLDYRHTGPRQEPLLWLADAFAGAVTADVRGESHYLAALPAELILVRSL